MHRAIALVAGTLLVAACKGPASDDIVAAPTPEQSTTRYTLADVQGCWWMDCGQPHAEFCISGERVHGDFEFDGIAAIASNRLLVVFPDERTFDDRIVSATRRELVLDGPAGRIAYRACP